MEFYTVKDFMEIMKVSRQTVYTWIKTNKIKAIKIDRMVRIPKDQMNELLKKLRMEE